MLICSKLKFLSIFCSTLLFESRLLLSIFLSSYSAVQLPYYVLPTIYSVTSGVFIYLRIYSRFICFTCLSISFLLSFFLFFSLSLRSLIWLSVSCGKQQETVSWATFSFSSKINGLLKWYKDSWYTWFPIIKCREDEFLWFQSVTPDIIKKMKKLPHVAVYLRNQSWYMNSLVASVLKILRGVWRYYFSIR